MKKAVIATGNKQYVVAEGDQIEVELLKTDAKSVSFDALLVIDGEKISVGTPVVEAVKVAAEIVDANVKGDKVTSIRFKAKKRVKKVQGHRQQYTVLKITSIK